MRIVVSVVSGGEVGPDEILLHVAGHLGLAVADGRQHVDEAEGLDFEPLVLHTLLETEFLPPFRLEYRGFAALHPIEHLVPESDGQVFDPLLRDTSGHVTPRGLD